MAKITGVWGIEVGQTALKALRCHLENDQVHTDAFDYIEYPKMLSHPEADPEELVRDALSQFIERNETLGYKIAISVPGQSGLSKFFKPPPVEAKKVGDIVKYEAKQQIPFDLDDVVWDYQIMPGAQIEEGYALESEVGLFAMKRDQVYRQLKPFDDAAMEVDLIQLAPLAMYNMLAYDRMHEMMENEEFDVEDPPNSTVMVALGTDSTDLIISNGFRVWQRSMPLGGSHFTRQLTKDLKMTLAKAEHLKRNTRDAEDPKLIIQTMRPVFNDLVTEIQRSIGFFQSIHKTSTIDKLLVTGNTVKLPGLGPYLGKNLGYDVEVLDGFENLTGSEVLSSPVFKENIYTFGVCYGLCVQTLVDSAVRTSLVPQEIITERIIRAKKPWALACAAALMLGFVAHFFFSQKIYAPLQEKHWSTAQSGVTRLQGFSSTEKGTDGDHIKKLEYLTSVGNELSGSGERRMIWIEFLTALYGLLPRHDVHTSPAKYPSPLEFPYHKRPDIYVDKIETKYFDKLEEWFTEPAKEKYRSEMRNWFKLTKEATATAEEKEAFEATLMADPGPTGPGWVVELTGYHYFNNEIGKEGGNHVRTHLTENFINGKVKIPMTDSLGKITVDEVTPQEVGFSYPLLLADPEPEDTQIPNPEYEGGVQRPQQLIGAAVETDAFGNPIVKKEAEAEDGEVKQPSHFSVKKYAVTFQFCWTEKKRSVRKAARAAAAAAAAEEAKRKAEEEAAQQPADDSLASNG